MKRGVALVLLACWAGTAASQQMSIFKCGGEYTNVPDGDAARADMLIARGCVRAGMTTDVVEGPAPGLQFPDEASRAAYLRWSAAMADRLRNVMPDTPTRREFVQTVWFESKRQSVDPTLVLALIELPTARYATHDVAMAPMIDWRSSWA